MAHGLTFGNLYGISELRLMLPGAMCGSAGSSASVAATSGTWKPLSVCCGVKNADSHATTLPEPSRAPRIDEGRQAFGSQPCSSARDHCTRTGRPIALASNAASAAASSWPLRP